jgi:hypothetical protein
LAEGVRQEALLFSGVLEGFDQRSIAMEKGAVIRARVTAAVEVIEVEPMLDSCGPGARFFGSAVVDSQLA